MPRLSLKEILKPALTLTLICLCVAGALAAVNALTAAPIAANEKRGADLARQQIFPGAEFESGGDYFIAKKDGAVIGYCVETEAQGYGGAIKVATGLGPQGDIVRVQVVACDGETPGLGTKVKEEGFLGQFIGQKNAAGVDDIASATYSSRGVVHAVNQALEIYGEVIAP
ncbi:MAG: FMN-binding protein [Oscillospiraceae bacterium]|nr:FMN-binding protein [Oscillospiraceae bacterium]